MPPPRRTSADRALESTLLAALLIHIVALFTMAIILLPAMPGAGKATPALRLAYIHAHPLLWHAAWFPWHLCALSDIALSLALLKPRWIPRSAALFTLAFTLIAFAIEQRYETLWDILAPSMNVANYAPFEHRVFVAVCCIAASLYAIMAMGWSWSLSFAPTWTRTLRVIGYIAWPVLLFAAAAPLLPTPPPNAIINAANQLGFTLMTVWYALALEAVLRRTRTDEPFGRMSPWRSPRIGLLGTLDNLLANSRLAQYFAEFLPKPVLSSHIHDVVYLNYLVDAERAATLLPEGLELQRLGRNNELTLFSILTYRHGRFGPRMLGGGASCKGFPSPIQSNWRLYVQDTATGEPGIFFVTTTLSKLPAAMLARMLSRGVPMHTPAASAVTATYSPACAEIALTAGSSSSPDLTASLHAVPGTATLPPDSWTTCFPTYMDLLDYAVPQGRALSVQSWDLRTTAQEIDLPIPPSSCLPLEGPAESAYLRELFGDVQPICFLVPELHFTMTGERTLHPGTCIPE